MRILHLETGRHLYGGARQAGYLINALAARGIDNLLVCAEGHTLAASTDARVFEWRLGGDLDTSLAPRLVRLIRDERADIVHVHSRRGADTFGGRAARAAGIPAVLTRRVESSEPGLWLKLKCRSYAAVVAISTVVENELLRCGIDRQRLRVIPSAVDTASFRPDPGARVRLRERYDCTADTLLAGCAAQFIPRKGHDFLLRGLREVRAGDPEPGAGSSGFRVLLFGQGPEEEKLRRQVQALGLDDCVLFCGFERDWPRLLPGLDLLLHPARREGLGAVVLEAMSAGVPVVASRVGGIVDALEDGVDGRLVAPDDLDAWREVVLALLADGEERSRIAAAARRKVESRFTIDRMVDSYIELYREVTGRAGGRRR